MGNNNMNGGRTYRPFFDAVVEWVKRSSFLRLLLVITLCAELLTAIMNVIHAHTWWGEHPDKLFVVGIVDALLVSIVALPLVILIILRLKQAEADAADNAAYLDNILRSSTDMAIAATDKQFRVTLFNPAAQELFGYSAADVMGRDIREVHHGEGIDPVKYEAAVETFVREREYTFSLEKGSGANRRFIEARVSGIHDEGGMLSGYVMTARDVTERRKALGMLAESEERFRSLVESSSDWVWEMDALSRYTYSSPKVKDILGFRPDEVIGKTPYDMMMPVEARRTKSVFGVYASIGKPFMAIESTNVHKDGRLIVLETSGVPIYDQQGELRGCRGISRDITGRRRFETALRESEAKFRLLSEESLVGVYIVQDSRFVYVNPTFARITGYDRDEIVREKRLEDLVKPESLELVRQNIGKRLSGQAVCAHYELQGIKSDGTLIDVEVLGSVTTYNGMPAIIGTLMDVTERRKTEEALRESESKFRTLVEQSLVGVAILQDGRYAYVNPRHAEMLGYTQEEYMALESILDRVHPDDRELVAENVRKRESGEVKDIRYRFRFLKKDGEIVNVEVHGSAAEYKGRPAVISTVLDITERVRAEAEVMKLNEDLERMVAERTSELEESEKRYRMLMEKASDGIGIMGPDGKITSVNSKLCEMSGYMPEEFGRLSLEDVIAAEDHRKLYSDIERIRKGETVVSELTGRKKDGATLPVEISANMLEDGSIQAIVRDVSRRKQAEEELRESEHSYRTLAKNLPGIVYRLFLREDNRMQIFNDLVQPITGYSMDELKKGSVCSIDPLILPEDRTHVIDEVRNSIRKNKQLLVEYRIMHKSGEIRHMQERGRPVRGLDGIPLYIDGVILDITELKKAQAEKDAMKARLNESLKMEAIGNLAGGIAHDFNNLLTVIQGENDLAIKLVEDGHPAYECLGRAAKAADRASELTRKLLIFGRRKPMEREPTDLNVCVDDILGMLKRLFGEKIVVHASLSPELWKVSADPSGLEQVVMNLALNARDAMPDGGRLDIRTENLELSEQNCKDMEKSKPGRFVRLSVSDTGVGMDGETVKHIFEPFFTTKGKGRGTGLGLSVVYGMVKDMGGWVNVVSEPGKGSSFDVYIEASPDESDVHGR